MVQPTRELCELVRNDILLSPYMPKHDLGQLASFTQCILDGEERRGSLLLSLRQVANDSRAVGLQDHRFMDPFGREVEPLPACQRFHLLRSNTLYGLPCSQEHIASVVPDDSTNSGPPSFLH